MAGTEVTANIGGGGGGGYMQGIAQIGSTLNDTWSNMYNLFKSAGWMPPDEKDKLMRAQSKLLEAQARAADRGPEGIERATKYSNLEAQDRQLGFAGINALANQRQDAQRRSRESQFSNALMNYARGK